MKLRHGLSALLLLAGIVPGVGVAAASTAAAEVAVPAPAMGWAS